ncbi:MAG: hypothetical protein FWF25_08220 [Propionibacteriaceae bacterium]|nr:hypothetical protein [Propionibacteriaceae bacterium]
MNRTIRTLVGLAASAALALSVVALAPSSASATPLGVGTYKIIESPSATVHAGPGSNYAALGTISKNTYQQFDCWTTGTSVNGDAVWGRIAGQTGFGYVADYWLDFHNDTINHSGLPRCPAPTIAPVGYFDSVSLGGSGSNRYVTVKGWAADVDTTNPWVETVTYIYRGSTLLSWRNMTTGDSRPDVHKVYPYFGNKTGFAYSEAIPKTPGTYTVKVYAMDSPSGILYPLHNGTKTVTIKK